MRRATASRDRRAAIAFLVLLVVIVGAIVELTQLGGGGSRSDPARATAAPKTSPPTQAPTTTTLGPVNYQVRRGDTLTVIARRFGVSIETIVSANQLTNQDNLAEGQILRIPPPPPVTFAVTPAAVPPGRSVQFSLGGAKRSESVTFRIDSPTGSFTGPPHTAAADGTVKTTYTPPGDATPGTYAVVVNGDQGTTAQATFEVQPSPVG
jgi:LysM repeat protein